MGKYNVLVYKRTVPTYIYMCTHAVHISHTAHIYHLKHSNHSNKSFPDGGASPALRYANCLRHAAGSIRMLRMTQLIRMIHLIRI